MLKISQYIHFYYCAYVVIVFCYNFIFFCFLCLLAKAVDFQYVLNDPDLNDVHFMCLLY